MAENQRWSVMYTKQVKQKRKVYQDGVLELDSSRRKVMLYDESDNLLENRFVKKDDLIRSGEALTFQRFLVDIGGMETASTCLKEGKAFPECHRSSVRKPMFMKAGKRLAKLSPSQKIIRDLKKTEIDKLVSSPTCLSARNVVSEWQVLYTSQVTQKAKKFHDGFLKLILTGSEGRQVMLYDDNREHLNCRFLKKDENVCLGGSLAFDGHLVEIEALQTRDCKPVSESTPRGEKCKPSAKDDKQVGPRSNKRIVRGEEGPLPKKTITNAGESSSMAVTSNVSWRNHTSEHIRAAHDILSTLRRPIRSKSLQMSESLVNRHAEECHPRETEETLGAWGRNGRANQGNIATSIEKSEAFEEGKVDDAEKISECSLSGGHGGMMTRGDAGFGSALSPAGAGEYEFCKEDKGSNSAIHEAEACTDVYGASLKAC